MQIIYRGNIDGFYMLSNLRNAKIKKKGEEQGGKNYCFSCKKCAFSCVDVKNLTQHVKSISLEMKNNIEMPYKCGKCGKSYKTQGNHQRHMRDC